MKRMRTSYADSPTVPEEDIIPGLEETILPSLRSLEEDDELDNQNSDAFGSTYGRAREGTRQLRSYIRGQLQRSRAVGSINSVESRDSRFESATGSITSNHVRLNGDPNITVHDTEADADGGYVEDYLGGDDTYSEGSWETNHTTRNSLGNITQYVPSETTPKTRSTSKTAIGHGPAREWRESFAMSVQGGSGLMGNPTVKGIDFDPDARIVPETVRRPVSVDAGAHRKRSSRVLIEGRSGRVRLQGSDYAVYI